MPNKDDTKRTITCSFCGKPQEEVGRIIQGAGAFICDECVMLCNSILRNNGGLDDDLVDEEFFKSVSELPKPMDIKAHLDEYVIGQDDAKISLAVSV